MVHIHFVHMANQIHEESEKWPTISNFLFCTLQYIDIAKHNIICSCNRYGSIYGVSVH